MAKQNMTTIPCRIRPRRGIASKLLLLVPMATIAAVMAAAKKAPRTPGFFRVCSGQEATARVGGRRVFSFVGPPSDDRTPLRNSRKRWTKTTSFAFRNEGVSPTAGASGNTNRNGIGASSSFRLFSSSEAGPTPASQRSLAREPLGGDNDDVFRSPYRVYEWEQTIKKSRFIGIARYAEDWKDASDFVADVRTRIHPKARHWCFAYRGSVVGASGSSGEHGSSDDNTASLGAASGSASTPTITERASDDGEPSGTAGTPILNALRTETDAGGGLVDLVVVVVRYSGGIKLGAGGLIRAYGGTAREVLREADQVEVIPRTMVSVGSVQPRYVGAVYELAARHGGTVVEATEDGTGFSIACDLDASPKITEGLLDATRGSVVIR